MTTGRYSERLYAANQPALSKVVIPSPPCLKVSRAQLCVCDLVVYACLKDPSPLRRYQSHHVSSVVFHDSKTTPLRGYRGMTAEAERVTEAMRPSRPSTIPLCTTAATGVPYVLSTGFPRMNEQCTHTPLC